MAGCANALNQVVGARKEFERRWLEARSAWDDSVQRAFAREHLEPIIQQVGATQTELERLLQVVVQARRNVH